MAPNFDYPATLSYSDRIEALRAAKLAHTQEKIDVTGYKDHDDHALILPPTDRREIVSTMSSSGMPIVDCLLEGYQVQSNHPSGGFFGPKICGENFRRLMDAHPVYINPFDSLMGNYMANFMSYRKPHWNPDFNYSYLADDIEKYKLLPGIGAAQHFCQDLKIGLDLGWRGVLTKIHYYREINCGTEIKNQPKCDFYDGLDSVVLGLQDWIRRYVNEACKMAEIERQPDLHQNLIEMADVNARILESPPVTFRDACQWILWYLIMARMYNGSGSLGRLDVLLYPYYQKDIVEGRLSDEEAIFHLACLLLHNTAYSQLGGPDEAGKDVTNPVSYLVLEAIHQSRIPANIGICVGENSPVELLHRGVEIMFEDKLGIPKFLGIDQTVAGFSRNHYPEEVSRMRAYSGCHWSAIPGREYTVNDCVKINFAAVFEIAFIELMEDTTVIPSVAELWKRYESHMQHTVVTTARALDFHMEHMHQVFPELVLDLLCYGPIEKGEDASHGGVEFYNLCIDGAALATVADSFAALEQRVDIEKHYTWQMMAEFLHNNWDGPEGERARLLMRNIPRYGSGGTNSDAWAVRIAQSFTAQVKNKPTPGGFNMIPGIFSWANTISMGKDIGATSNGRRAGEPISHGSNPDPGFRRDGAPTAMAVAIASVQPGYGNTAPMQLDLDPGITSDEGGVGIISDLIRTHFKLGGTQINLNILDADQILDAHKNPDLFPDLVVRVTGFSAYFASLSPEFRQLVVDRIIRD